jgi:hypothetical protein
MDWAVDQVVDFVMDWEADCVVDWVDWLGLPLKPAQRLLKQKSMPP